MKTRSKYIIKVLVVEDSPAMCKVLTEILNSDPQILVAGIAHNGKEAVEIVSHLKPDVITMDIKMPVMDGFEATKQIMACNPTPILVVSAVIFKEGMGKVFEAFSYGALDVIDKGKMEIGGDAKSGKELIDKVKFLSTIKVIRHPLAKIERKPVRIYETPEHRVLDRIVAIVSSTGGPNALREILRSFSCNFPCGIVVVQHITDGFVEGLVEWLDNSCQIKVKVAEDSEEIRPGVVYIAPCDLQMRIEKGGRIRLSDEPACNGHRPSGDILLKSVAEVYREWGVGVILTGMGRDGAVGMKAMKEAQGLTIAQDEESCVVFSMPNAAIEMDVVDRVVPLNRIAEIIVRMLGC